MEATAIQSMHVNEEHHWWFVARRVILSKLIQSCIDLPNQPQILEAGCGTGGNLALLQQFGDLEAFEYDSAARAFATSRSITNISYGHIPNEIDYPDRQFDMVALFDVLEHLENDAEALTALRRKLSPDGSLVLTVPAMPWLWSHHDVAHHHYRRYTASTLRVALDSAGFEVRNLGYFNSLLFPLAVVQRFASRLFGTGGGSDAPPPFPLNALFKAIFSFEARLLPRLRFPIGVSLYAVASPKH